jgi:hypothetical protein
MDLKFVPLLVPAQPSLSGRYGTQAGNQCVWFIALEFIRSGNGRRHTTPASVVIASSEILLAFYLSLFMLDLECQKS